MISDLIEKEKSYRNAENTPGNESNNEESSSDIKNQEEGMTRRRRRKYVASENGVEDDSQESGNDTENDSQETESSIALKRPPPFTLKIPVNIVRPLKCTGHSSLNVLNAFGTITTRFALHAITRSPRREITLKRAFFGFTIVEQLQRREDVGNQILFPF